MNITSCNKCGVMLDKDILNFSKILYDDNFEYVVGTAVWSEMANNFVPFTICPVCKNKISES